MAVTRKGLHQGTLIHANNARESILSAHFLLCSWQLPVSQKGHEISSASSVPTTSIITNLRVLPHYNIPTKKGFKAKHNTLIKTDARDK